MMRWRPWPPLVSRKYQVRLVVRKLLGCDLLRESAPNGSRFTVEVKWKGPRSTLGSLLLNSAARNFTGEADVVVDGGGAAVVNWDEEFQSMCNLTAYKDNVFHPWEIAFTLFNVCPSLSLSLFPFALSL